MSAQSPYAIVDIAGRQFKVQPNQHCVAPRLPDYVGSSVTFDKVLLTEDSDGVKFGKPFIGGAKVTARVLAHVKADKVIVFKKKRRKGYKTKQGHRQDHTHLLIEHITT